MIRTHSVPIPPVRSPANATKAIKVTDSSVPTLTNAHSEPTTAESIPIASTQSDHSRAPVSKGMNSLVAFARIWMNARLEPIIVILMPSVSTTQVPLTASAVPATLAMDKPVPTLTNVHWAPITATRMLPVPTLLVPLPVSVTPAIPAAVSHVSM